MEYCTHLGEVEYFENEGMRQLMEDPPCWSSSRCKVIEHKVSRAARGNLERVAAVYLEGEGTAAALRESSSSAEALNTAAVVGP
jgi:hypothetical protein